MDRQGLWQDAEKNWKLRRNLRAYHAEELVNYAEKNANYVEIWEQITRKNQSTMMKNGKIYMQEV